MLYWGEENFDVQVLIDGGDCLGGELGTIIWDYCVWQTESANDVFPIELYDSVYCDGHNGLCFYPLGEVVYNNYQEFMLVNCHKEGPQNVIPPNVNEPRGGHGSKIYCRGMIYICKFLAFVAIFSEVNTFPI